MGYKIAIDFGTTNSVVARWDSGTDSAENINILGISDSDMSDRPPIVPSLIYVNNAKENTFTVGQTVRNQGLDAQRNNRLFRNFKRGIVSSPSPEPREIDGVSFADRHAGEHFIKELLNHVPYSNKDIEQLVLTAPVASFEGYLSWLNDVIDDIMPDKIRVVDESTAAALGYSVTKPGAVVLVFDFGGGTLDLSLVQLPERREKTGGFLHKLRGMNANQHTAKVIAKAGRIIGGSDIDQWILAEILKRTELQSTDLASDYSALLTACEQAKIALSTQEQTQIQFHVNEKGYDECLTRKELEEMLSNNEFDVALRRVVDKVMHVARQHGIFKEDIHYVLMVGGTSLMPFVQQTLAQYFTDMAVRADKPFTAVAEGALQIAAGYGLDDYLIHSYGLRHMNPDASEHEWDEIIAMGSRYPIDRPIDIILGTAHSGQQAIELIIGEIDTDAVAMVEVKYEDGQAVFVAQTGETEQKIIPLNENTALNYLVNLDPKGQVGQNRIKASFTVDDRRRLKVSVFDLQTNKLLLEDVAVVTLR